MKRQAKKKVADEKVDCFVYSINVLVFIAYWWQGQQHALKSAMVKAISGHSMPKSVMAMAIVAMALPLTGGMFA